MNKKRRNREIQKRGNRKRIVIHRSDIENGKQKTEKRGIIESRKMRENVKEKKDEKITRERMREIKKQ